MTPKETKRKPTSTAVTRRCPRCRPRLLEPCSYEGHEVDVCPKCGGLWCEPADWDPGVLGTYPAVGSGTETSSEGPERAPSGPEIKSQPRSDRSCPSCGRALMEIRVGGAEGCELDQCDQCGGVWFDHGEWDRLECLRTFEDHQQELQRSTTWKEWAFQFFLRLPVEFNVRARRTPEVTVVMIALCVIGYLIQSSVGRDQWPVFATTATRIWRGEGLYGLVTSSFLHGNLMHLVGNMYFLYILGDNVEDALGRLRYTLLYLGSAVAADFLHVAIFPRSDVPLIGASGAVFGVMAAYMLLYPKARLTMMFAFWQVKVPFWGWMGLYLGSQAIGAVQSMPGQAVGVAYWGHIGGFFAGLLFVFPQRRALIQKHPLLRLLHGFQAPVEAVRSRLGEQESAGK